MNIPSRRFIQHIRIIGATRIGILLLCGVAMVAGVLWGRYETPVYANAFTFTTNLRWGDSGEDVRQLQKRFNEDPRTQVATTGPGSPGSETTYFGPLTHNAAIRYQELYREEILTPVDLFSGTGFVGPSTRAHLNKTVGTAQPTTSTNGADSGAASDSSIAGDVTSKLPLDIQGASNALVPGFQDYDELILAIPSLYDGPRGTTLSISGFGFTRENNTVHLGDSYTIENIPSSSGQSITFSIPSDAPYGKHTLYVSNANGTSGKELFFVVTREGVPRPTITSVTPSRGFYGEEVTIHGTGFTSTGNEVRASYAIITDLESSDGTTLTFLVQPPLDVASLGLQVGEDAGQDIEWPVWFYVVNGNGVASGAAQFTLIF